jgi:hypothetical protein
MGHWWPALCAGSPRRRRARVGPGPAVRDRSHTQHRAVIREGPPLLPRRASSVCCGRPCVARGMRDSDPGTPSGEAVGADSCAVSAPSRTRDVGDGMRVRTQRRVWGVYVVCPAERVLHVCTGHEGDVAFRRLSTSTEPEASAAPATRKRSCGPHYGVLTWSRSLGRAAAVAGYPQQRVFAPRCMGPSMPLTRDPHSANRPPGTLTVAWREW